MNHEEALTNAITEIRKTGVRVIRLDNRSIPDAFILVDDKVIAIEVETDGSPKYSRDSEFDEVISICRRKKKSGHLPETYLMVLRLRKKGMSYSKIKDYVKDVAGIILSKSTVHDWCRGKSLPRSIHFT